MLCQFELPEYAYDQKWQTGHQSEDSTGPTVVSSSSVLQ